MTTLTFTLNNKPVSVEAQPNEFLAEVLRYRLGLTGTKIGCNEAECGSCTVIVDGQPVDSCIYPAVKVQGARIQTIEGIAPEWQEKISNQQSAISNSLHPLQENFIKYGAVQCGFCTPGLIMQAKALLDSKQGERVNDEEIKIALKDTYCRCTGYVSVLNAVKAASGEDVSLQDYLPETKHGYNVVGEALPRADAIAKVTGAAIYTDDVSFPNMLFGATLRAMIPHALIKKIDVSKAKVLPGVHAVLTHEDVPGSKNHGLVILDWPVLCYDKVRYVGDAVAIVAADSIEIAKAALQLIEVEYEPLPIVDTAEYAHEADAPQIHNSGNLLKHIKVAKGNVEKGFAEADVVIERKYHTASTEHAFLEPECSIGRITDDGRYEIYVGSQIVYQDREQVAAALGIAEDQVRIISTLIGGGFGGKEDIAGQIHVALLAKATGHPVKMLYTRHESLIFHPKRHATTITVKLGAKKDGRLTAAKAELYGDTGAYASLGEKVLTRATTHANGPYAVANAKSDCFAMYTNNVPAGAFRGFGVTQSAYAVEMTIDELAEQLQIDPIELRKMNALRVGSTTNTGQVLRESVGLIECIDKVTEAIEADKASVSGLPSSVGNKKRAWGIAVGYKNTGLGGGANDCAGAEIEVYPSGLSEIRTSSAEIGQGLPGVLAAIVAEELGLPIEQVNVLLSDTDRTPNGGPTTASRQTFVSGNAARHAAIQMRSIMSSVAAERLDVSPDSLKFVNGRVEHNGKSASFAEVVQWMQAEGRSTKLTYEYTAPTTQPLGTGGDMHFAFSYAAHAALVEVDTDTGEVKVLKVIAAHDIGRAINPLALEGQIDGGIVMGLGNALTEEFPHEKGIPYVQWLARYKMPSIKHTPEIKSFIVEHESAAGPFGAKGVGEISSIPITPAITNAIYNAVGVRVRRLPVDQDTLLRAMKSGAKSVD